MLLAVGCQVSGGKPTTVKLSVIRRIKCTFNKFFLMIIRYTIKLTKLEVEQLHVIINKGSHTSQTFRAAYVLLNCDEGKYPDKVTNE